MKLRKSLLRWAIIGWSLVLGAMLLFQLVAPYLEPTYVHYTGPVVNEGGPVWEYKPARGLSEKDLLVLDGPPDAERTFTLDGFVGPQDEPVLNFYPRQYPANRRVRIRELIWTSETERRFVYLHFQGQDWVVLYGVKEIAVPYEWAY